MSAPSPPSLQRASTALLCVDLQPCYYAPPIPALFPRLEEVVTRVVAHCRQAGIQAGTLPHSASKRGLKEVCNFPKAPN